MRTRYFEIGDRDWAILLCWDYDLMDYDDMWAIMKSIGASDERAKKALRVLSKPDTGMTMTSMRDMMSVVFVSETSNDEQWLDTLLHEIKHVVEHIGEFYRVDPQSEPSAYLQGEIGRLLFPIIMQRLCKREK